LSKPTEVVHLDLSQNKFTEAESQDIQKAFNLNNSIYGFHFEGNNQNFMIDKHGYLQNQKQPINKAEGAKRYDSLRFTDDPIFYPSPRTSLEKTKIE
jgi:hypothetical protein